MFTDTDADTDNYECVVKSEEQEEEEKRVTGNANVCVATQYRVMKRSRLNDRRHHHHVDGSLRPRTTQ